MLQNPVTISAREDTFLRSLPQLSLNGNRETFLHYFENGWALTEELFSGLADDAVFYRRPYHKLRHPMIFYYAHPAALYVNKLRLAGLIDAPVRMEFEKLFETGVDEMRWDDLYEGEQHIWPPLSEVRAYRGEVYRIIRDLILHHPGLAPGHVPITQYNPLWALVMGFEHERIHLETSSVLMRELPVEHVQRPPHWPDFLLQGSGHPVNEMIPLPACEVQLGKPERHATFGWDNEYGIETRQVRPFSAAKYLVSNGEFLAFVTAGGYIDKHYWSADGWDWRQFRNAKHPTFWVAEGTAGMQCYRLRTIFEVVDMQWNWPVCVNFHEAKAYCAWRSEQDGQPYRLPTEAEHHVLRDAGDGANLALHTGGENPVDAFPANSKGFHDASGNVWQWCEDHFHPLPGAKPHPYYDDFSMPCYDGEHQMILGGSFISTGDEASAFARFHFRPHFFQHTGFRMVCANHNDAIIIRAGSRVYETQEMLNRYMLMHWGTSQDIYDEALTHEVAFPKVAHLPLRCAELVTQFSEGSGKALDLGCAVGRASFEMARHFTEVVGVDYSHEFVTAAGKMQHSGTCDYLSKESGAVATHLTAHIDPAIDRTRVRFEQGNAMALPPRLHGFDAVLLSNVLCRLNDPAATLAHMQGEHALVKPGGVLVMTTPFSWLEEYTPKERWLTGVDDLRRILTEFTLLHEEEIPFMLREHRRKFEYIITKATVWRRRAAA